jgi:hypothetical protein
MTTMTTAQFEQHMHNMARHYRWASRIKGPVKEYELPKEIVEAASRPAVQTDSDPLQGWKSGMHSDSSTFADVNRNAVTNVANSYMQSEDSNDFDNQMNNTANSAKQQSDHNIDGWKNSGIALGHQHPEMQSTIITVFRDALSFFTGNVLNGITGFIANAVQTLIEWIRHAIEAIGNFFGGVVNDIRNFFSHL